MERPKNYAKSANRALEVLCYLAEAQGPARAADIADAVGMARSSADQLLKTLVAGGYLVRSATGMRYFPSIRLASFGRWINACYPADDKLRAMVEDVHSQVGGVVTLSMQNDCYMQLMEIRSDVHDSPWLHIGSVRPVLASAMGGAALSTKTKDEVRQLVRRARRQRVLGDAADGVGPLLKRLRHYRTSGYCTRVTRNPANGVMDYWSIAMSLPPSTGDCSLVLGFGGPAEYICPREIKIVSVMRETISRRLNS